jgi:cardiolipin synthase
MNARHIPNIITVCRILLVYPVIRLLLAGRFDWALALFVVAGLSDAVDGFLAKYFHWQSRLGSYLDPLADKLLLISSYVALAWLGLIPSWLTVLVVLRDVVIFGGAVAYYFLLRPFVGQPLLISKLNTLFQLLLVFAVMVKYGVMPLSDTLITALVLLVTLTTLASGAMYVYIWGTSYYRETHAS